VSAVIGNGWWLVLTSQDATSYASNHTSSEEHADVSRACTYRSSNDEDDASKLYRSLPTIGVCRPRTDDASDDRTSTVNTVESTDDVGRIGVALLALWCEIKVCVD
jgi:hypothetical protein